MTKSFREFLHNLWCRHCHCLTVKFGTPVKHTLGIDKKISKILSFVAGANHTKWHTQKSFATRQCIKRCYKSFLPSSYKSNKQLENSDPKIEKCNEMGSHGSKLDYNGIILHGLDMTITFPACVRTENITFDCLFADF